MLVSSSSLSEGMLVDCSFCLCPHAIDRRHYVGAQGMTMLLLLSRRLINLARMLISLLGGANYCCLVDTLTLLLW